MTDTTLAEAAFAQAEATFERAVQQSLRVQEAEFQKLAEAVLADLAARAIEQILAGVAGAEVASTSGSAISAAIAKAATAGGRFL